MNPDSVCRLWETVQAAVAVICFAGIGVLLAL